MALYLASRIPCYPQFLPDLQAKSPAEYDAYLDVLDGPVLKNGAAFERNFPQSTLRLPVCELMAQEWRAQGKREEAIAAAEQGLAIAPDYIPLLVEVAELRANGAGDMAPAVRAAGHALELLDRAKAPLRVLPEDWIAATTKLRVRAHTALGMAQFKKDDLDGAMNSFQSALAAGGDGDPMLHYRLGRLYGARQQIPEARRHLKRATSATNSALRELASKALSELK